MRNAQIGWSNDSKLLFEINKRIDRLIQIVGATPTITTTTTTSSTTTTSTSTTTTTTSSTTSTTTTTLP